jgi:hypothetical protein
MKVKEEACNEQQLVPGIFDIFHEARRVLSISSYDAAGWIEDAESRDERRLGTVGER